MPGSSMDIEDMMFSAAKTRRIEDHPVLPVFGSERRTVSFTWNGKQVTGYEGEMVSSALTAIGVYSFGNHRTTGEPLGLFCANGQCAQCTCLIDGIAQKACITPLREGMVVEKMRSVQPTHFREDHLDASVVTPTVLIIGAGPAGCKAASELGRHGVDVLLVDDHDEVGGKLTLQTHKFFGSVERTYAGTRGYEIGKILERELVEHSQSVDVWLSSQVVAVFTDGTYVVNRITEKRVVYVRPTHTVFACGARERMLPFPGNGLPGVMGAGGWQTVVNRDRVRICEKMLCIGGGNVGVIAAYQAFAAGIDVAGIVEAAPQCGGYKVHVDKTKRLGCPIYTRHTIVSANTVGADGTVFDEEPRVRSATICQLDDHWQKIPGTEKTIDCDAVLVAIGLVPADSLLVKAREFGLSTFTCGDCEQIAEASAAMLTGVVTGYELAKKLGFSDIPDPADFAEEIAMLRSRPGETRDEFDEAPVPFGQVAPVIHCHQAIPCNACTYSCPKGVLQHDSLVQPPNYGNVEDCIGCMKCVSACPGLAITLVDARQDGETPMVTLPFELETIDIGAPSDVLVYGSDGSLLGRYHVEKARYLRKQMTYLITVRMDKFVAKKAASCIRSVLRGQEYPAILPGDDTTLVCTCNRITAREVREWVRVAKAMGITDANFIKGATRMGMGACGAKNCGTIFPMICREEGWRPIQQNTIRGPNFELPMSKFDSEMPPEIEEVIEYSDPGVICFDSVEVPAYEDISRFCEPQEVLVLGAGSMGLGVAVSMASRSTPKRTMVVDFEGGPGQQDNKRAIGGVRATHMQTGKVLCCLRSLEIFREWEKTTGHTIEYLETGYLFVAYRQKEVEQFEEIIKIHASNGLVSELISPEAVQDLCPGIEMEGLRCGLYSPHDGVLSPFMFGATAARFAFERGVQFRFNTAVHSIVRDGDRVVSVIVYDVLKKQFGRIDLTETGTLMNCLGASVNSVFERSGMETLPISPDSHEAFVTEPCERFLGPMVVDIRPSKNSKNYYFYQAAEGSIVGCLTPDPPITGLDIRNTSEFLGSLVPRVLSLIPRIGGLALRRLWRGRYSATPDGSPLVGRDRFARNHVFCLGLNGQGMMLSCGLGEAALDIVLGVESDLAEACLYHFDPYRSFDSEEILK